MDWVALQGLKRMGLVNQRKDHWVLTEVGRRALQRSMFPT